MQGLNKNFRQSGFSLVELMVGVVIGLLTTIVIMQTFSAFEGQKRSTSGSADAQTNSSLAILNLQSNIQMAGYGLPMSLSNVGSISFACASFADFDPDGDTTTSNSINLFPISIVDGGGAKSDTITVRYSRTAVGALPMAITDPTNATSGQGLSVENNMGCGGERTAAEYAAMYTGRFNMALITRGTTCGFSVIKAQPATVVGGISKIKFSAAPAALGSFAIGDKVTCMGDWQNYTYSVANNQLLLNGSPIISGVVKLHAQYGISAVPTSNQVTQWVDTLGATDRNRIKAVRLSIVLINGLKEKTEVTPNAPTILWPSDGSKMVIDVTSQPNWKNYRYRALGTTIPLRNMIWTTGA